MKIKSFSDTDIALVEFSDFQISETKEVNDNIYIDLDAEGNLVSMTIEHAKSQAKIKELSFIEIDNSEEIAVKKPTMR